MIKYYTMPGYGGSDSDHWQSYFDIELDNCERINQESWTKPVPEKWVKAINDSIDEDNIANTIIITHSLGGIALAHWVQKYGKTIKGALIVAPPDLVDPPLNFGLESFAPVPEDRLPFPSILVSSSNDIWMKTERAKYFAEAWGSELVILQNAGHINGDSGYNTWDEGLKILERLL